MNLGSERAGAGARARPLTGALEGLQRAASPALPAQASLEQAYVEMRRGLVRLAVALVDDPAVAEDIVHDVFAAAARNWQGLVDPDAAAAYLRRATVNRARSELRKRRFRRSRPVPTTVDLPGADDPVLPAEEHSRVVAAVRSLPRRQREIVLLRYWQGLSEAQIAKTLGISTGSVKSAASRGLSTVRDHLNRSNP